MLGTPPKWDSDHAADDDIEPTSEPPNQDVLVPQEAETEEPEPVAAAAAIVPVPILTVAPTVAASGPMHLADTAAQIDICFALHWTRAHSTLSSKSAHKEDGLSSWSSA